MIAVFEDELRNFTQNPRCFSRQPVSLAFLAQRILSILFLVYTFAALTTISPALSAARLRVFVFQP
jgi:hypothetical protein